MHKLTRQLFTQYLKDTAENNDVPLDSLSSNGISKFTVEPAIQQALVDVIREEIGFLDRISMPMVTEQSGARIGLDINATIASNTDTDSNDRQPSDPSSLANIDEYMCRQTNFDTAMKYSKLDQWRKFPDFAERISRMIAKQKGRDLIMIGFNGTSRAKTSNRTTNPLLQDVAVGWLKKIIDNAPQQVLADGAETGEIRVGKGGDYQNLDALGFDIAGEKIADHHQEDTDLVFIVGRELLHDKYLGLVSDNESASERIALDVLLANRTVAGKRAYVVPFFPKRGILLTSFENLSIYMQEGGNRRTLIDNVKRDQYEDYMSMNLDYMIEDYTALAYVPNVTVRTNDDDAETATWG